MADRARELETFQTDMRELVGQAPAIEGFLEYIESAEEPKTLDRRTKELMSLAIGVVVRCEPCILWHTDAALEAGATQDEIEDVLLVAVAMGGGPALAYATKAYQVLLELSGESDEDG